MHGRLDASARTKATACITTATKETAEIRAFGLHLYEDG